MNMTRKGWLGLMVASSTLVAALIGPLSAQSDNDDKALLDRAKALFKPLPESVALENNALTPKRVALGKALFLRPAFLPMAEWGAELVTTQRTTALMRLGFPWVSMAN